MTPILRRRLWAVMVLLAMGAAFGGLMLWRQYSERQAIASLTPEQRRAIFASTLSNFEVVCSGSVRESLARYCTDQASFLRRFPECGADCERVLSSAAPSPSR